ncbi:MAG: hypothetical protein H6713_29705 [Myxococcales bacterium]|nr:hypothetical protein [Myxococcales bacterium]
MDAPPTDLRAPASPLRVCGGCGSLAPTQRRECQVCDAPLDHRAHELAPAEGGDALADVFWVAVRSEFQCRVCGKLSPINHLELDGEATCLHCATNQAFDAGQWREALAHAHAVGDLAGPDPEGRRAHTLLSIGASNPLRELGVSKTFSEHSQGGVSVAGAVTVTRSLRVRVSPGHPLDENGRPLTLERRPDPRGDVIITRGWGGRDQAEYALPPEAREHAPGLRGVIAGDHRVDRLPVRVQLAGEGGAAAVRCPSCGAPLAPPEGARLVTCNYCSTTARIPERALTQFGQRPRLELWWLAFAGPSSLRLRLEAGESAREPDADDRDTPRALKEALKEAARAASSRREDPPHVVEQAQLVPGFDPRRFAVGLAVPLAAFLVVGWLWFGAHITSWL